MAAKNSIKIYAKDCFYHIYNRGVEKRLIFLDDQDYAVFLSYLKTYLLPQDKISLMAISLSKNSSPFEKEKANRTMKLKNFSGVIDLVCFCLMPNHFHMVIRQNQNDAINHFVNALGTRYAGYFNRKYHRVGPLFQGVYKAVMVQSENQLLHLSRYIHTNPKAISTKVQPSSLPEFIGLRETPWIKPNYVLECLHKIDKNMAYSEFIKECMDLEDICDLLIENETE